MDDGNHLLGDFLRERRARLDPAAYGLPLARRRTPGLRREEVAQLAHVSATWYTWLEQGRGGAPSADVLDRLARAFSLNEAEREHLYLLAQDRPPKVADRAELRGVSGQLQRVLDGFGESPAIIKTPEWTILAWNRAAATVLYDYDRHPQGERNLLRFHFTDPVRRHREDWEPLARMLVDTVRRDVLRAGWSAEGAALIEDLKEHSEEFRAMWADQTVHVHGEGLKTVPHPLIGPLRLEYSTFAVEGHSELALVVFNPATDEDREKVRQLLLAQG